ncbi:SDR family oxidoreductase [Pseudoroseicyclus aestuarii]|uniref:Ribitol 2-dehydrogenase n=1 Tax=Pseudoroseicyclus aestuarii TaxID=1795041 RepID=A0A318SLS8_9RHOB|nr:SDR family oxidoreductase [Pseudoroseicyclus aestuarii]PYE80630.1 ribitol 2-dehydrogenase [Pseudoroseicyclus aestuarii]
MSGLFEGKVAVVTGGASGIGLASARALLEEGAQVVLVDRDAAALEALTAELGEACIAQRTDLLDAESCAAMVPEILAKTGRIDILHCNAGSYIGGALTDTTPEAIERMIGLNVTAVMKNVHAVIPHMAERGSGDIMVTCSVAGHTAVGPEPVYSGSKWAITSFVQTMRRQLMKDGIRVGQVSPGPVDSALLSDWEPERLAKLKEDGALMEASAVAEAVVFALSRPRTVTIRDVVILPSNFDI